MITQASWTAAPSPPDSPAAVYLGKPRFPRRGFLFLGCAAELADHPSRRSAAAPRRFGNARTSRHCPRVTCQWEHGQVGRSECAYAPARRARAAWEQRDQSIRSRRCRRESFAARLAAASMPTARHCRRRIRCRNTPRSRNAMLPHGRSRSGTVAGNARIASAHASSDSRGRTSFLSPPNISRTRCRPSRMGRRPVCRLVSRPTRWAVHARWGKLRGGRGIDMRAWDGNWRRNVFNKLKALEMRAR